jgi:hypothetical protein
VGVNPPIAKEDSRYRRAVRLFSEKQIYFSPPLRGSGFLKPPALREVMTAEYIFE